MEVGDFFVDDVTEAGLLLEEEGPRRTIWRVVMSLCLVKLIDLL